MTGIMGALPHTLSRGALHLILEGDASAGKPSASAAPGPRGGPAAWSTDAQTHIHKTQSLLSSAESEPPSE